MHRSVRPEPAFTQLIRNNFSCLPSKKMNFFWLIFYFFERFIVIISKFCLCKAVRDGFFCVSVSQRWISSSFVHRVIMDLDMELTRNYKKKLYIETISRIKANHSKPVFFGQCYIGLVDGQKPLIFHARVSSGKVISSM
jgi:hypothetical protein